MRQKHSKSTKLFCRVDVTAFAGVMVLLVAIFLLPARFGVDLPNARSVDLAKVSHPVAMRASNRGDALLVAVERDGRVWLGSYPINPSELPSRIREAVSQGAERKVYIRADA